VTEAQLPDRVTVIGEALIDLVPTATPGTFQARPGGSPYNVAIGLARLGQPTTLMARLADNAFGRILRTHAATEGLLLHAAPLATEPTSLAVVSLTADAQASYDFYLDGTADWHWSHAELHALPEDTTALHFGSLASWTQPAADRIHDLVYGLRSRGTALISYDPNIRPLLLGHPSRARPLIERSISTADLVKASDEDVQWLYPDLDTAAVAARWTDLGAGLVVITAGPHGAHAFTAQGAALHRPGRPIQLADTVGAGDSFAAALLHSLLQHGANTAHQLRNLPANALAQTVDQAILASAMTCERIGADPPTSAELAQRHSVIEASKVVGALTAAEQT
jgi:fructokinase